MGQRALTRGTGGPTLYRDFSLHHPYQPSTATGSQRRIRRPPPYPPLQIRQHHLWWRRSPSSALDWSHMHDRGYPSPPLPQPRGHIRICTIRDPRQAAVGPICLRRLTGFQHRTRPKFPAWAQEFFSESPYRPFGIIFIAPVCALAL